ncbi:hypothetical protein ACFLTE_02420 [Bacteroidota bacterium]
MEDAKVNMQINEINNKLDFVIEEITKQKQKRQAIEDFVSDASIIGKDFFNATVKKLDNAGIELDYEALENFSLKLLRNLNTMNKIVELMESANDLFQDVAPIINQTGLDITNKLYELDQKGYFEFFKEISIVFDRIVTHFSVEDIRLLADNSVTILETIKSLTQPDMLKSINNAVEIYKNIDTSNIPEYSLWKAFKTMNTKDGKKAIGFIMTFLQNISKNSEIN